MAESNACTLEKFFSFPRITLALASFLNQKVMHYAAHKPGRNTEPATNISVHDLKRRAFRKLKGTPEYLATSWSKSKCDNLVYVHEALVKQCPVDPIHDEIACTFIRSSKVGNQASNHPSFSLRVAANKLEHRKACLAVLPSSTCCQRNGKPAQ